MNDSAIIYDEVIESHDEEISFNEKKAICKTQNFYNKKNYQKLIHDGEKSK